MSIKVEREPDPEPPFERCAFCRAPTSYWYWPRGKSGVRNSNEVACCPECAKNADAADVPSKAKWMRRERIAFHGWRQTP